MSKKRSVSIDGEHLGTLLDVEECWDPLYFQQKWRLTVREGKPERHPALDATQRKFDPLETEHIKPYADEMNDYVKRLAKLTNYFDGKVAEAARKTIEEHREEALALARDHERYADAYDIAIEEVGVSSGPAFENRDLHRHTANFLRLVAEGRVN